MSVTTKAPQSNTVSLNSTYPEGKLEIIFHPENEDILRTESQPVLTEDINTPEFKDFCKRLKEAMLNAKMQEGWTPVGISAVQIGHPIQVFWAYDYNHETYELYINPEIEYLGSAQDVKTEGCLSIPDVSGDVKRYKRLRITYTNEHGESVKKKVSGWNARLISHEYDHLLGILFIDKLV